MVLLVLIGSFSRECCDRFWVPGKGRARVELKLLAQGLDEVATRQIRSLCAQTHHAWELEKDLGRVER